MCASVCIPTGVVPNDAAQFHQELITKQYTKPGPPKSANELVAMQQQRQSSYVSQASRTLADVSVPRMPTACSYSDGMVNSRVS